MNNPIKYIDPNGDTIRIYYKDADGNRQSWNFTGNNHETAPKDIQFAADFLTAYDYDTSNGGGENLKEAANSSNMIINIQFGDESMFIKNSNGDMNINWNPRIGIQTDEGYTLSAATILEHEAAHNVSYLKNPKAYGIRNGKHSNGYRYYNDDQYGYKEERRVITGAEFRTAYLNGEIPFNYVRPNHKDGQFVPISNPINSYSASRFLPKLHWKR